MATTLLITLTHVSCYECGVVFGIESNRNNDLLKSHDNFWCPNGHSQRYIGQTAEERRIAELERTTKSLISSRDFWSGQARDARQDAEHERRRVNGYKGVVARTKKKIAAGRCPCCSHQFKNLESHMRTQHPHYDPAKGAEALAGKAT
jgi:hypothetical protein